MKTGLLCIGIFAFIFNGFSQQIWKQSSKNNHAKIAEKPKHYESLILDKNSFLSIVKNVSHRTSAKKTVTTISLPIGNSTFEAFEILEAPNFSKGLALKFPEIKSYVGKSTSSNKVVRLSYSKYNGLTAFISTNHGTVLIKPTHLKSNTYIVFNKKDSTLPSGFECGMMPKAYQLSDVSHAKTKTVLNDGFLRKYRIAIATTGEYSNFFLTGNETNDTQRKAVVLSAINTALTRINSIFENDFGITLELVPDNDKVIHLNAATDPFSSITLQLTDQVHHHLDAEIGSANYDVGHLLADRFRNYGVTYIGVACLDYSFSAGKGSAFSSGPNLGSDDFYMVFAHELGHQFGAWHVQSNPRGGSCREETFYVNGGSQVEPGSGSSIMSYAGNGLCLPEVKNTIDPYFNYVNIRDVISQYSHYSNCAELISTGNNAPTVNAGNNYTIPKSTPFILEGIVNDIDNNSTLSYCWEQNNPEPPSGNGYPQSNWTQGPLFRSFPPSNVPFRYMPKIEHVLTGNLTPTWEVLPSVSRSMNFVLTVRDKAPFGPKTASDEMTVTVDGNSGPFTVTSQHTNTTWNIGETKTITWNVANTNQAPVNVNTVAIYLSTDGGYTYPFEVATNVPNTGSYNIIVPDIPQSTSTARIMVKAEDNIFYAINTTNFSVNLSPFSMAISELEKSTCQNNIATFNFNYKTYSGFNETTTFSIDDLPNGVMAIFTPNTAVNNNTTVNLTISGLEHLDLGVNDLNIIGSTNSLQLQARARLNIFENLGKPILTAPQDNALQIFPNLTSLTWENNQRATSYTVQLATDAGFSNIIEQTTTTENTFTPSQTTFNTDYYWRVKSDNECGSSSFSDVFTYKTMCSNDPSNISITNITYNSATISWTDYFSSSWEIKIVENTTSSTKNNIITNTNLENVSGLNSNTTYGVYIKSLCQNNFSNWIGPINFTTSLACPSPSNFKLDNVKATEAILSWTSNSNVTGLELEYGLSGFTPNTGTKIVVQTTPYTLKGLDSSVDYDVYLKVSCPVNPSENTIVGPVQFKTLIDYCSVGKFYDNGGLHGNYTLGTNQSETISSRVANAPVTLIFNTFDIAEDDLLYIFTDGKGTTYRTNDFPGTITSNSGIINIFLNQLSSYTEAGWDADVVCGSPSCQTPSNLIINNITSNSADLSWTSNDNETQWILEYGEKGFVPNQGQGTTIQTSTNTHTLQGISSGTNYNVYVKAICGNAPGEDDSYAFGPVGFTSLGILNNNNIHIDGFKYFPNPVNHTLTIEANEVITRIEIYNFIGQLMSVKDNTSKKSAKIDLSHLSIGMYYIRSFSNEKKEVFNIMKK